MQRSLLRFEQAIKSEATRKLYAGHLKNFLAFTKIKDPDGVLQLKDTFIQELLEDYLFTLKKRLNPNSIPQHFACLELFFAMNDKVLNFKKIKKMFPAGVKTTGRDYWTTEDIKKMLDVATNHRTRALIHFLASTGCRIGSLYELKRKHVQEIENCKAITFYPGSIEEYIGFLTPEASQALDNYLLKRKNDGELITNESPLFRTTYSIGSAKARSVSGSSLKKLMMDIEKKASLTRVKESKSRHNIQILHGFRKRYNNILKNQKGGNISIKEKLMGHSVTVQLDGVYHNPTIELLFEEFKTHILNLTISNEERDKIKIETLAKKTKEQANELNEYQKLKADFEKHKEDSFSEIEKLKWITSIYEHLIETGDMPKIIRPEHKSKEN